MTLSPYEQWLNIPNEWIEDGLNITLCFEALEIKLDTHNLVNNSNHTLIEANLDGCYKDLLIYNKLDTDQIILNLQGSQLRLANNLQIIGKTASLTIVNGNDAFLTNISTTNVKELSYISGTYKGLDLYGKILYDKTNAALFISDFSSNSLTILSSKVVLSGTIYLSDKLLITIEGDKNQNYNLDAQNLHSLSTAFFKTAFFKISDYSKSGAGINLHSSIFSFNIFIDGNNFVTNNTTLIANRLSLFLYKNSTIDGTIHAADMIISSTNLQIKNGSELKTVSFKGYEDQYPQPIKLRTKDTFICEENVHISGNGRVIIQAGKNLTFNGIAKAKGDINLEGEAITKEVGNTANIISHFGNIIINNGTRTPGKLAINGIVLAEQGIINYIVGESFFSNGINAGATGIFLKSNKADLSKIEINKIDESVVVRWKTAMAINRYVVASLMSLANNIQLVANEILLNEGASILNLANLNLTNDKTGAVHIKAGSCINHQGSNITANGAVTEEITGQDGCGLTFESSRIESRFADISITSATNIKLDGNLTGETGINIRGACLENTINSGIHTLQGNLSIYLSKCQFNNFGAITSHSTLTLTVDGGDTENHNLLAGDDIKITVHGRKNFINSGVISSNNHARIGLEIDAKILLKPDSIMYVGSYDFGHFFDFGRLRIGGVECHGCSIYTIKSTTSIVSASILSIRIAHYEKTEYQVVDQKTFTTNTWKERQRICGVVTNVRHKASYVTLTLLENHHDYYGPAINQHSGDVIYDVGVMSVIMSSVTGDGTAYFPNPTMLQIRSEQSEKIITTDQSSFTHMNTISNVQNAFALTSADVNNKYRMVTIAQPKDSVNSILSFRNGMEGNFIQVSIGRGRSIISDKGNSILPAVATAGTASEIIADITVDSASKDKTIIVYNWHSKVNQLEIIALEDLRRNGFDVSKLIHPSILNSKIWGYSSENLSYSVTTSAQESELSIKPIFFLKNDPLLASFIDNPLNIVHFLASLAFNEKGLVYTIGDGHFIAKLVDQAVFILLGKLTGVTNTKILNTLALNAKYEQQLQNLTVGSQLTLQQTKNLSYSIIWPVWLGNCINEIKCLDFRLYFNPKALENSLSKAAIASEGEINFEVLGDILVGLEGQIKSGQAVKFNLQGNFVNLGLINSNNAIIINAKNIGNAGQLNIDQGNLTLNAVYDIVNIGTSLVNKGNVHLKAGHDIKELILINAANPVPYLTKRAIYAIGGNLYYEATNDITQQASVIFASGDITMISGNDIKIETTHNSRIIKEERSRKHYLIQSTTDQYDAIITVEGSVNINAGNNFIGSGIRLLSNSSDINISASNKAVLKDKTGYAWNYQGATKTKFLGKSSVSVSWTTSQTANLEITAPGGRVYISSGECITEGGIFDGQKPIFKCDKLLIKPHEVVNKVITTTTQSGMFKPSVPIIDLAQSNQPEKHLRDHTIAGPIHSLINMQGPLDLLPAVNLISSIPGLKADYKLLGGAGLPSIAALVGALLSKYISASISLGTKKTTTSVTQTISTLTQVSGSECEFKGVNGEIAANINCQNSVNIEFDNLKLVGAKNTLHVTSKTESSSFDVGVSLNGVSFGVSFGKGKIEQDQVVHNSGIIYAKNVSIKINNRLEVENAQINGKNVTVEALSIKIQQVIDGSRATSESYGGSLGVTIGWTGAVMPTISAEYTDAVQQSQVVHLLSGITGESVEVTAQRLTYNIEAITAVNNLNLKAESLEYISLPYVENIDTELRVAGSVSPRSDGKTNYAASIYSRDGDEVMSIGYSSELLEGINDIKEFLTSQNTGNSPQAQDYQEESNDSELEKNSQKISVMSSSANEDTKKDTQDVKSFATQPIDQLPPWDKVDFTLDPLQYILMDPDIKQNHNINHDKAFGDGAIAAVLTTLDQGTEEIFKYGVGEKSGVYKYYRYKMSIITGVIDYKMNLQEQQGICPTCDETVNKIVAAVQTVVGNGLSGIGAVIGGGPFGAVAGAATVSTLYSASDANKQVGELARPIAQYIVSKYNNLIKNKNDE